MKPDGVTMETTEPTEAIVGTEPPSTQGVVMQAEEKEPAASPNEDNETAAAPPAAQEVDDRLAVADAKVKPNVSLKVKPIATTSVAAGGGAKTKPSAPPNKHPGTAPNCSVKGTHASNTAAAGRLKKTTMTTRTTLVSGAGTKRPTVPSSIQTQTKMADKKPVGNARVPVATATATNCSGVPLSNSDPKSAPAGPINGARPRTTGPASRPATSTVPKPSTSTAAKTDRTAVSKATRPVLGRPATGPSTSRLASSTSMSKPTGTSAPTKTTNARPSKPPTSRAVLPSTVRATAPQPTKTSAVIKKDVGNRPAAAVPTAKKPTTGTTATAKKTEPSKARARPDLPSKGPATTKASDAKPQRLKTQQEALKPTLTQKVVVSARLPTNNKPPLGRTPPASPASKMMPGGAAQAKRGLKPTQAVKLFGAAKKTKEKTNSLPAEALPSALSPRAVPAVEAIVAEPIEGSEAPPSSTSAPNTPPSPCSTGRLPAETLAPSSPPSSPVSTALPPTSPSAGLMENAAPSEPEHTEVVIPPEASVLDPSVDHEDPGLQGSPSVSKAPLHAQTPYQVVAASNLNEEDEEERETSLPVSVSEMSGTTQPTEESRPGSAGLIGGGAAWRASGALLSELDSEDVSGSQQGASELSAPGVLEGTESTDDLGDGSLKGAIDMEGASAGSPDLEKVPDIPANDFDEEEYDDDHVYDMDVGSERAEAPPRPRHDNEVYGGEEEEEDDDDVEMASEAVTESGLESYGNADEDDLAEDERLDNLNRVLPPPPQLPPAPDAPWDQPSQLADPWAPPLQAQQPCDHAAQPLAPNSPTADPWQADSETPTQSPAHAWLELGSAPFIPQIHEASQQSSDQDDPPGAEDQAETDQSGSVQMQTLPSATSACPAMSLGSDISTPEELRDYNQAEKLQTDRSLVPSDQADPNQGMAQGEPQSSPATEKEEGQAEMATVEELPPVAPSSPNSSSCSSTADEASDTEGEALLDQGIVNEAFDRQRLARCLSAVEEGEEGPYGIGGDALLLPAKPEPSCMFDATSICSAPTSGQSYAKSPSVFSLEERPDKAKEDSPFLEPPAQCPLIQPSTSEQNYMQCGQQEVDEETVSGSEDIHTSVREVQTQDGDDNDEEPQPPYYSAICEKTENCFSGFNTPPQPHRRRHGRHPQQYTGTRCDVVMTCGDPVVATPRLTCADLPPRNASGLQARSPQLHRLAQHQKHLLELQQRRELHNQPAEKEEEERTEELNKKEEAKGREEEEETARRRRASAEEEAPRRKAEKIEERRKEEVERQRRDQLQFQLQQQQEELQQRQQIMQWQQELEGQQAPKGQSAALLLSPSSGLCTIYEALENSEEEELRTCEEQMERQQVTENDTHLERVASEDDKDSDSSLSSQSPPSPPPQPNSPRTPSSHPHPLDWGKKVDMVQQLINQSLLLTAEGCCCAASSPLLLLPGGAGGTLSPLESSLWPHLLPPLTPPSSATVTSVSSYSPEAASSAPQGEWTVVELETHH